MSHQLQNKWTLWEQASQQSQKSYGSGDRAVCEFGTVEEFWKAWSYIPKPSEVFYDGHTKKEIEGRTIGGFCLFKKGIKPEWEDPANATGSELVCRTLKSMNVVDIFWENLTLGLIGETIDEGDEICGARIVNKTTSPKLSLKLEIWLRNRNSELAGRIKERLLDALMEGGEANKAGQRGVPDFQYKPHG